MTTDFRVKEKMWKITKMRKDPHWSSGRGDMDVTLEDFNPCLFLAKMHDTIAYSELRAKSLPNLQKRTDQQQEDMLRFVTKNVDKYTARYSCYHC